MGNRNYGEPSGSIALDLALYSAVEFVPQQNTTNAQDPGIQLMYK